MRACASFANYQQVLILSEINLIISWTGLHPIVQLLFFSSLINTGKCQLTAKPFERNKQSRSGSIRTTAWYFSQMLEIHLLFQIGSGINYRVIDVKNHTWMSDSIIQSLPSLHAISGCDAVSAFHGIGKTTWSKRGRFGCSETANRNT